MAGSRFTRRTVLGAAAATLFAGALSGCAGGQSTLGQKSSTQLAMMNDNGGWVAGYQAAGDAMAKLSGYGFNVNSITNNYNQIVKMSIQTRKVADVVKWQSGYPLQELVRTQRLAPLDDIWQQVVRDHHVDPSLKEFITVDGHVYGLPLYKSHFAFYYSKSAFATYDLRPPESYEEFIDIAETLHGHGVTPFSAQYSAWNPMCWFEELLTKTDPEFYLELTNGRASYTDPTVLEVLERWRDLMQRGWFTALDLDPAADCGPLMKQGKLGMIPYGTWNNGSLSAVGVQPGEDFGLFNLPPIGRDAKPSVIIESGVFALPSASPNHEAAMRSIADWLHPDVQKAWTGFLQDTSANPSVTVDNPAITELEDQLRRTEAQPLQRFYESSPPQLIQTVLSDLSEFMLQPDDYRRIADNMQAHADEAWNDWNLA